MQKEWKESLEVLEPLLLLAVEMQDKRILKILEKEKELKENTRQFYIKNNKSCIIIIPMLTQSCL